METISWVVRWSAAVSSWGYLGTTVLLSGHLCSYNYVINTNKAGDNSACSSDVFPLYCLYMMTINLIFPFPVFFFNNRSKSWSSDSDRSHAVAWLCLHSPYAVADSWPCISVSLKSLSTPVTAWLKGHAALMCRNLPFSYITVNTVVL